MKITASVTYSEGSPLTDAFRDGNGMPVHGNEAIFPIIRMLDEETIEILGTGFFISYNGLFVTAKHVITNKNGEINQDLFGVQMITSTNPQQIIFREIQKAVIHPIADVAIGFLFDKQYKESGIPFRNKSFMLSESIPAVGTEIATFAYPNSELIFNKESFSARFTLTPVVGVLEEYYPTGRDRVFLPSKCFRTTMGIRPGASGGAVGHKNGSVFGINSTGWDTEKSEDTIGFVSSITDIFGLKLKNIRLADGTIHSELSIQDLIDKKLIIVRD